MNADKKQQVVLFEDYLAGLLNGFWHCTLGNMNTVGNSWDVSSHPINSRYWTDEKYWRKTQSMGISMAKFASLVVQAAHSPEAKHWATPFVNAPFDEMKLTPYLGGLAYDTGPKDENIVGITVSNLAAPHDQLLAAMLLAKYLQPTIRLNRVSVYRGETDFDFGSFALAAQQRNTPFSEQSGDFQVPAYVFHLVSPKPGLALEMTEFHATRPDGLVKPESGINFYTALSVERPINGVPILGFTLGQS